MPIKLSHPQYVSWLKKSLSNWLPDTWEELESSFHKNQLPFEKIVPFLKDVSDPTHIQIVETPNLISIRGLIINEVVISINFDLKYYHNHELAKPQVTGLCLDDSLNEENISYIKECAKLLMWKILHTNEFSQISKQFEEIFNNEKNETSGVELKKIIFVLKNIHQPPLVEGDFTNIEKKPLNISAFQKQPVNSFFNTKNIPTAVQTPPALGGAKKSSESLYDLLYIFADGTQLNLEEIHFHPHAKTLHKNLLPSKIILSHLDPYTRILSDKENHYGKYASVLSILWNALKTQRRQQIDIFFGMETPHDFQVSPLNEVCFVYSDYHYLPQERRIGDAEKVAGEKWELSLKMLRSQQKASTVSLSPHFFKNKISFLNGVYDPKSHVIHFHPYANFIYRYLKIQSQAPSSCLLQGQWFEIDLSKFESASPVITLLQEMSETYNIDFRLTKESKMIDSSKVLPYYFFEDNACKPSLNINLKDENVWLFHFTSTQHLFLDILSEGLKNLPSVKENKLQLRRKTPMHDMDTRFLKHRGVAFIFIFELIEELIKNCDSFMENHSYEITARQILESVFKKVVDVIFNSNSAPAFNQKKSVKTMYSHQLVESLTKDTIFLIKKTCAPVNFLYKKQLYQIPRAHFLHLPLMKNWLHNISKCTGGVCYIRQNKSFTPSIDSPPHFLITAKNEGGHFYPLLGKDDLPKWQLNPWRYYKASDNVKCYYKGLELHFITSKEFTGQLRFLEDKEKQTFIEQSHSDKNHIDWFALSPNFLLDGQSVSPEQIYELLETNALKHRDKLYVLNDNSPVTDLRTLQWFWKRVHQDKKSPYFLLPRYQILDLLALRATGLSILGNKQWEKICEFYDNLDKPRPPIDLPSSFCAELKPYQNDGLGWILDLYNLGLGGILADDMGLGKTVQALSFFEYLRSKDDLGHNLVIVPTSLTYNWISECEKFTPDLPIIRFASKDRDQMVEFLKKHPHAIVVLTYGLLNENQEFLKKMKWNIHIYDEAQNLKNLTAKRTASARQVSAKFKLCLTGTPLENHYGELFSLMDLIVPGSLGDFSGFKKIFVSPYQIQSSDLQHLKLQIKPLILRRTKSQILKDLPPKTEVLLKIPFCKKQKLIYKELALSWNKKVKDTINGVGESRSQIIMLTALLRLRQACSDPASIPQVIYPDLPPKISTLTNSIDEIVQNDDSALVFTQFLTTLRRLEVELEKKNIRVFILHGGLNQKKREKALREFNEYPKGAVFIMTLKTGGTGLNLTKASYVFHLEPWWNPAVENQATDRTHRIGQTKAITVYRYLMKESVEEKVERLKERKSSKFSALFKDTENHNISDHDRSYGISKEDFAYLIGPPPTSE